MAATDKELEQLGERLAEEKFADVNMANSYLPFDRQRNESEGGET